MQRVKVDLEDRSYEIEIGREILWNIGEALKVFGFSRRLALVSNPTVYDLYGGQVAKSVKDAGFDLAEIIIPDGEEYKTLHSTGIIYEGMLKARLNRRSAVIALGGGVVGDITGFAASTYMRGIDFIQIPTTLLAQVDSSVGGKTGVNHELGKNMIGTFWQPRLVWIDIGTLKTLPRRELFAGLAEVIKYGVIWDRALFDFLEDKRDGIMGLEDQAMTHLISRSCEIKAEVVSKDERESGLRAILNYGHTVGHAVETVTKYTQYLHGEAVAIGMHIAAKFSQVLGLLEKEDVIRIRRLIESYSLPTELPSGMDMEDFLSAMSLDKKAVAGELKFILPREIGAVEIHSDIAPEEVRKACG